MDVHVRCGRDGTVRTVTVSADATAADLIHAAGEPRWSQVVFAGRPVPATALLQDTGICAEAEVGVEVPVEWWERQLARPPVCQRGYSVVGTVTFPAPRGIQINMMPLVMGDPASVPEEYAHYWPLVEACGVGRREYGRVGYLTIDEGVVERRGPQRRGGLHTEVTGVVLPGCGLTPEGNFGGSKSSAMRGERPPSDEEWRGEIWVKTLRGRTTALDVTSEDTLAVIKRKIVDKMFADGRGCVPFNDTRLLYAGFCLDDDACTLRTYGVGKSSTLHLIGRDAWWGRGHWSSTQGIPHGGLYMASSVSGSVMVWDAQVRRAAASGPTIEPLRPLLGEGVTLRSGELCWLTDRTPHEALPLPPRTPRQFFRLVTSDVSVWYARHSTRNRLGVHPAAPAVTVDKFAAAVGVEGAPADGRPRRIDATVGQEWHATVDTAVQEAEKSGALPPEPPPRRPMAAWAADPREDAARPREIAVQFNLPDGAQTPQRRFDPAAPLSAVWAYLAVFPECRRRFGDCRGCRLFLACPWRGYTLREHGERSLAGEAAEKRDYGGGAMTMQEFYERFNLDVMGEVNLWRDARPASSTINGVCTFFVCGDGELTGRAAPAGSGTGAAAADAAVVPAGVEPRAACPLCCGAECGCGVDELRRAAAAALRRGDPAACRALLAVWRAKRGVGIAEACAELRAGGAAAGGAPVAGATATRKGSAGAGLSDGAAAHAGAAYPLLALLHSAGALDPAELDAAAARVRR